MNWTISSLDVRVQEGQYQNVVIVAHWQCTDTQTIDGKEYSGRVYSTCSLPAPEGSFTPYANLTQDIVLGWIWANGVDKASAEAAVQSNIDLQINPVTIQPPLPWAA